MSRIALGTPCPATHQHQHRRLSTLSSMGGKEDRTEEIEYTRVVQEEFAKARPRRPVVKGTFPARKRAAAAAAANVQVFEDVLEDEELVVEQRVQEPSGVLLAKPARKGVRAGVGRPSVASGADLQVHTGDEAAESHVKKEALKKEPRRRTIFVPSDDTTIMTIHPGANTTNRLDDTFQLPDFQPRPLLDCLNEDTSSAKERQPARRPRMSLAVAPRRMPLQQMEAKNSNLPGVDVAGQNGGKENLPPGFQREKDEGKKNKALGSRMSLAEKAPLGRSRVFEPTAASQARQTLAARNAVPMAKPKRSPKTTSSLNSSKPRPAVNGAAPRLSLVQRAASCSPKEPLSKESKPTARPAPWKKKTHFVAASDVSKAKIERYPVIKADIAQPELYEDGWLSQQEVALTELINQIFINAKSDSFSVATGAGSIREQAVKAYHQPEVAALHKRLQASLHYGALSTPRDIPSEPGLTQDLGIRRRYIHLWLDTYNFDTLCAAAEVVVGRSIPLAPFSPGDNTSTAHKITRRAFIGFLETFFITVEEVSSDEANSHAADVQSQKRSKTLLRSLMLVWLLDRVTVHASNSKCLFKVKSAHKTSASVLDALASMLLPTVGDIGRTLRHLDYSISHVQDPLDEISYRVDNLAVDLRDGILLTKLVELLLYQDAWPQVSQEDLAADATVTIQLPDAKIIESARFDNAGAPEDKILSRHLKMPCLARAQKMHNVEVALSALSTHGAFKDLLAAGTTAEAIVDGHRELTINFLWTLMSSIGLDFLLDRKLLLTDIRRLGQGTSTSESQTIEDLLQTWASSYSSASGIQISNLTSSFADGKAYAAIVNAFAQFFDCDNPLKPSDPTSSQLRLMGCSEAFIRQIVSTKASIPSRQTTLSNLAFLASRLLPLAARHHAALTIQRAYRRKRSATVLHQRVALMRMAADCAKVVRMQHRLTTAAVVVQRAWRDVLAGRIARLEEAVEGFQALARGWKGRKLVALGRKSGRSFGYRGQVRGCW